MSADTRKLIMAMFVVSSLVLLTITGHADFRDILPIITIIVGYMIGNGKNAIQGNTSGPILKPKTDTAVEQPTKGEGAND